MAMKLTPQMMMVSNASERCFGERVVGFVIHAKICVTQRAQSRLSFFLAKAQRIFIDVSLLCLGVFVSRCFKIYFHAESAKDAEVFSRKDAKDFYRCVITVSWCHCVSVF